MVVRSAPLLTGLWLVALAGCDGTRDRPPGTPGTPVDTGVAVDTGIVMDAGGDAGTPADAGPADTGPPDTGVQPMTIPDPGTDTSGSNWIGLTDANNTPMTARPVGIVDTSPGYVEGTLDVTTGNGFYVFRAGAALTTFDINLFGAPTDFVHLHEGNGLVFGDEVPPTASTNNTGTWPVTPGDIYVVEIHAPNGGFY